ncbi:hypothetical protein K1719_018591 [Acacia pycnantha]|nr:hypothetical protein K1719_018591 [Acacia pycnantha]
MASISSPSAPPNLHLPSPKFSSSFPLRSLSSLPFSLHSHHSLSADATAPCRCVNPASGSPSPSDDSVNRGWDSMLQDLVRNAIKRFDSYVNSLRDEALGAWNTASVAEKDGSEKENREPEDEEWDWDRWRKHFQDIDEQERLVSILKSQISRAVCMEDFEDAARLKVAIAAAATHDSVGRVISHLNKAIEEERYTDAAFLRDKAGAGLVGWWSGISKDANDPLGLIIRITPEHGRYVARSYSPRQLATSAAGVPLFEIFLTVNKKGEYKLQAVYLKRGGGAHASSIASSKKSNPAERLSSVESPEGISELFVVSTEDPESGDDKDDGSDPAEGMPGFQNVLKDMIPGRKIIEEDEDEEDEDEEEDDEEEKENETESLEIEDAKSDLEGDDDIEINTGPVTIGREEQNEIALKVVIGSLVQKLPSNLSTRKLLRVPAKLENGRGLFSFTVEKEVNQRDGHGKGKSSSDKSTKIQGQRPVDHVIFDLAKFIGRGKVPYKVLKDVGELISHTLNQVQNHQPLSGSTIFNRIEMPASSDPLNGLYIGAHGLYSSEIIQLRRKFGQWQEDSGAREPSDLEFYEYVEAFKLTGDPYVPAGQVAFRAKIGKRYQLPHKGIIPEEFGVIARYKGQGRLAEPGFRNPRWVDGELVILDGKYIKAGPVVGFVYWAHDYQFLVFFNRLRLQP